MRKTIPILFTFLLFINAVVSAQENTQEIVDKIINEAKENSQLENLAHHLMDRIGPRLVGTPQMDQASEWIIGTYDEWGISAEQQVFGKWKGWERGVTHVDMVSPWVRSLEAMQLAWNPNMPEAIEAEVVTIPKDLQSKAEFNTWVKNVKGKVVLAALNPFTGRPDYQWKEFALEEDYKKYRERFQKEEQEWKDYISKLGLSGNALYENLEEAGAAGIFISYGTGIMGASRIFDAKTKSIPTINIMLEDYGLLYRLAEDGTPPTVRLFTQSKDLGEVDTHNTIARIEGSEKPEEYILLSAHLDSWDGATGATDNGTGTITMMEVARILKEVMPQPKRTIIIGHWGSEEQGLNGSRGFVEDNPDIIKNLKIAFNQDNGTGRVVNINGQGFLRAYEYMERWLDPVPDDIKKEIKTTFPGMPSSGGSDHASFTAAGVPGIFLSSLNWGYFGYTWHTNRDTYDKIVFDEVRRNVILTAILTYMAAEDEGEISHEKRVMPKDEKGEVVSWPEQRSPTRRGRLD